MHTTLHATKCSYVGQIAQLSKWFTFYSIVFSLCSRTLETAITENLFRVGADALDLASLNIQRGRDHGVSYCRTREALGLEIPQSFNECETSGLFSAETVELLERVYE